MEEAWKQFETWVDEHGGRHTPERRQLFEAMCAMPALFTTADMAQYMEGQAQSGGMMLSRPTVYNALEAFVQCGLLEHIHVKGGNMYVRVGGAAATGKAREQSAGRLHTQVLLVCSDCESVKTVKAGGIPEAVRHLSFGHFVPTRSITIVHGRCAKCTATYNKELKQKLKNKK